MLGQAVRRFTTSAVRASHYAEGPGQVPKVTRVKEPAFLCREQVEVAGDDGAVLWQWLYFPLHHSQAPDPEEVKLLSARLIWHSKPAVNLQAQPIVLTNHVLVIVNVSTAALFILQTGFP
ncbi:hypothetical protein QTP86_023594 [Hemibagrus guttatus]|nr:hypothetical protein QTP86_023594 [Hemibagrus guttatus]